MVHYSLQWLKVVTILVLLSFYSTIAFSQNSVSIGTTNTNPKAVLWLSGTNQGIIIPIVTNKINVSAGPTEKGMVIFDDSDKKVYFFDGTAWNQVSGSGAAGAQGITINGNTVQLNSTAGSTFNLSNAAPTGKGQLLVWDGTQWDATLAPTSTGQTLTWDNTIGKWAIVNASLTLAGDVSGPSNNTTLTNTSGNNIVAALNHAATTSKLLPAQISAGSPNQVLTTSAGNVAAWANLPMASGTVTNIATGTGLTGGPITTTGTIALANTGVAAATYGSETQIPQMTVDAQGRITSARNTSPALASSTATGFLSNADWNTFNNKLAGTLTNGNIFIGNASNVATEVAVSGDVTISNLGVITIQPDKITSAKILDDEIIDADIKANAHITDTKLATISTPGKVSGDAITFGTIGGATNMNTTGNVAAATLSGDGSAITNLNASNLASGTVPTARIDVGTTANKIVQLDATGKLPAVDGSQLTNLPAGMEIDPTVQAINGLIKSNGSIISAATAGVDYLTPTGNGFALTSLNANNITSGTLPIANGGTGATTPQLARTALGLGNLAVLSTVTTNEITDGTIVGSDISASAAIADTKLAMISSAGKVSGSAITSGTIGGSTSISSTGNILTTGTLSTGAATVSGLTIGNATWPTNASGVLTNDGAGNLTWAQTDGGGTVKSITKGVGLVAGEAITTTGTIDVNVGTGAKQIIQLDEEGRLPAVDGSQLTNLPSLTETDPAVKAINGLVKSNGNTISPAIAGTDYLTPNGSGAGLTNLNADNISSGTLTITKGGTGSTTAPAARTALGLGSLSTLNAVASADIIDNAITDSDINTNANIAGTKINPNFGAQAVSTTGTLTIGTLGQLVINASGNITKINNVSLSFPTAQGQSKSVLTNDGSGNLSWALTTNWGLNGNAGTNGETNFIGTTDNSALHFRTNNIERFTLLSTGLIGIGTNTPSALLHMTKTLTGSTPMAIIENGHSSGDASLRFSGGSTHYTIGADASSGSFVISNNSTGIGTNDRLTINSSGYIGIGTNNPGVPLDISSVKTIGLNQSNTIYFNSSSISVLDNNATSAQVALRASGALLSIGNGSNAGFYVTSDERIKRRIGTSDSKKDLATLMKLRVTDYAYVDSLNSGNVIVKGVFAQQTEAVYPQAVSKQTAFIPNIYALSHCTTYDEQGKTLQIVMRKPHGLRTGDNVKLISITSGEAQRPVLAADSLSFTIDHWNEKSEKLFVYGKEVSDFRIVDYDRLFTLNISATQELVKIMESQQKVIDELKAKADENSRKDIVMEEKLRRFESNETELNALRSEIEKIKAALGLSANSFLKKEVRKE